MIKSRKTITLLAVVLVAGTLLGMKIQSVVSADNTYEQLQKLEEAFSVITKKYVENVDSSKLARDAIQGMIDGLDPHSVYIDADRMEDVRENFAGSFEGIGISYEWTDGADGRDTVTVIVPLSGGPSEEVGILPGDRIIKVDGRDAIGYTRDDVDKNLKGRKGSQVVVTIKRPRYPKLLDFTITRDKIPIYTVDASFMLDSKTGYIKLNRFARTTHEEVLAALVDLKSQGMERLVFDLRGNAGGYMEMAIKVADEFLSAGKTVVATRSRHTEFTGEYASTARGVFEQSPIIMLVDENSASASEIVAGALQDHDRALIVGRRTFGKGLVQRQYPLSDGSVIQMTTSRYYTPSGRLIQTPYHRGDKEGYYKEHAERFQHGAIDDVDEFVHNAPDSLKFYTTSGRLVLGGGGIIPDVIIPRDTLELLGAVVGGSLDYRFIREWMDSHPEFREAWKDRQQEYDDSYQIDDAIYADFWKSAADDIKIVPDDQVEAMRAVKSATPEEHVMYFGQSEAAAQQVYIKTRLKAFLARRIWGLAAWYPIIKDIDPMIQKSQGLWNDASSLAYLSNH